jgi:Sap, sulfolipid-1-addressing protein
VSEDLSVLVPMAIGFALSPAGIVELILVLFSQRRVLNSIVFVLALLVLSFVPLGIGALGASAADSGSAGADPSAVASGVLAVFGLVLVVIGISNWRQRHDANEPAIFASIAGMGPGAVAFLTLGVTFVNPKNLPLLLSAGGIIAGTDTPVSNAAVFMLLGTLPYTAAMLYSLLGGDGAQTRLDALRGWLVSRNRVIMGVLCTALGLLLLMRGVTALL